MCVIALAYKTPHLGPLLLVANRDEFYARPSAPLDWWHDAPDILGGRDLQAGGGWLALDRRGRFAAVTNVRDGFARPAPCSRGELVQRFVSADDSALAFAEQLSATRTRYAPFNLLFGTLDDLYHYHSQYDQLQRLTPGIHTLSNATLDTPWPKCQRLAAQLAAQPRPPRPDEAFAWLADAEEAPVHALPNTGVGLALEKMLSPVLIRGRDYGTRASTVLTLNSRGEVTVSELTRQHGSWRESPRQFTLRPDPHFRSQDHEIRPA